MSGAHRDTRWPDPTIPTLARKTVIGSPETKKYFIRHAPQSIRWACIFRQRAGITTRPDFCLLIAAVAIVAAKASTASGGYSAEPEGISRPGAGAAECKHS